MHCMDRLQDMARRRVLLGLLEDMMYEPLYDELRTKQQLGYSVGCCLRDAWPRSRGLRPLALVKGVQFQ